MIPQFKIEVIHDSETIQFQDATKSLDVWLRENKGANINFTLKNSQTPILGNQLDMDDIVQINIKDSIESNYHQVFGGYITEASPQNSVSQGVILPCKAYGYDIAFDRMRAAVEYGAESANKLIITVKSALLHPTKGLIPRWTEIVLNSDDDIDSGYNFNTDYIYNDVVYPDMNFIKYVQFPYMPINDCLRTLLDLYSAHSYPNPGLHWTVIPDGTTAYFCMDKIGTHAIAEDKWPAICPVSLTEKIASESYTKQKMDANYIVYFGKFEYPTADFLCEGTAGLWECYLVSNPDDHTHDVADYVQVGEQSIKLVSVGDSATQHHFRTPSITMDLTKIGTATSPPEIQFYLTSGELGAGGGDYYLMLYSGDDWSGNRFMYPIGTPAEGKTIFYSIKLSDPEWVDDGADMTDIRHIGISFTKGIVVGEGHAWVDGLRMVGIITRGAYDSALIESTRCKIKLVTDSLARCSSYSIDDDSGTVAQFAKAELLRARTTPYMGNIKLKQLYPTILPGQIVEVRPNFPMRITEVHHHLDIPGGSYSEMEVTDDLINSYPIENITKGYNQLMKATKIDFQDRDRGDLKGRDIDILQSIIATNYAPP